MPRGLWRGRLENGTAIVLLIGAGSGPKQRRERGRTRCFCVFRTFCFVGATTNCPKIGDMKRYYIPVPAERGAKSQLQEVYRALLVYVLDWGKLVSLLPPGVNDCNMFEAQLSLLKYFKLVVRRC